MTMSDCFITIVNVMEDVRVFKPFFISQSRLFIKNERLGRPSGNYLHFHSEINFKKILDMQSY